MKKKILIVNWRDIKNPEAGGAEVHYHEIFKRFDHDRYEISVLASTFKGCTPEETVDCLKIYRQGARNLFNFHVYFNINKFIRQHNFDLIIDDVNKIPFFLPCIVKKPLISLFHHLFGKSIYKEFSLPLASYVYLSEKFIGPVYKNTRFMAVSKSTLDELLGLGFKAPQGRIIHNGVDLERYVPDLARKDPYHLLYLGRIKRYKNIDFLIKAAKRLKKDLPELKVTIAGEGDYLDTLKQQGQAMDFIKFLGVIDEEEKIKLYQKAHLFVTPSIKEGWSITNIEASACGTPVLASNVEGLRDSVKQGENGYLFEYNNIEEFCKKALEILENKTLADRLFQSSRKWAKNFSWDKSTQETENFILECLSK
jgi:glycosyltransferase involved in cell wall biosynthesis